MNFPMVLIHFSPLKSGQPLHSGHINVPVMTNVTGPPSLSAYLKANGITPVNQMCIASTAPDDDSTPSHTHTHTHTHTQLSIPVESYHTTSNGHVPWDLEGHTSEQKHLVPCIGMEG